MKTLEFHSEVGPDGKSRVEVPIDLPPGPVDGVLVVQPSQVKPQPPYDMLEGAFAGLLPDIDIDPILDEMNNEWKKKLEVGL